MTNDLGKFSESEAKLFEVGEKRLIEEIIRPMFNPRGDQWGVGDDCALMDLRPGASLLISTDRVPADLTAFRLGILDYYGLGRYLACLNLSDIAACGGRPLCMLLNLGLSRNMKVKELVGLLEGALAVVTENRCYIAGGDLSDSSEMSISATAVGQVERSRALSRRTAKPGDTIFFSRPIGVTPIAFEYYRRVSSKLCPTLSSDERTILDSQFTSLTPMFELGELLSRSQQCSSCMDNTDGLGQTLVELAECSSARFVIDRQKLVYPEIVSKVCNLCGIDIVKTSFSSGADFSLVGTLSGEWNVDRARASFGTNVILVGRIESGAGVAIEDDVHVSELEVEGWNYYSQREM